MQSRDFSICPNCGCAVHPAFVDVHMAMCGPRSPAKGVVEEKPIATWPKSHLKLAKNYGVIKPKSYEQEQEKS